MLGTHLVCDLIGNRLRRDALRQEMANGVAGTCANHLVWETTDCTLFVTAYQTYPSHAMEDQDYAIHLEGFLYHVEEDSLAAELTRLAHIVFAERGKVEEDLARWLLSADGDFLIVIRNKKTGNVAVVNDVLARLPTYYSINQGCLVLSRDLRLVARLSGKARLDRMAIGQYLLLGFCPSAWTWFEGVHTLQPASLITNEPQGSTWRIARIHDFNLEGEEHTSGDGEENAQQLAARFRQACCNRSRWGARPVVSLSGGLDSRAVAAGLWKEGIPFVTGSFLDQRHSNQIDFQTAQEIAATLGVEWYGCHLSAPRGQDLVRLLDLKHGLNNLRMSSILPFFHNLKERFGDNILYLTGDGGGDALGDSVPYRHTPTLDSLITYLVERYQIFTMQEVAALTGLRIDELRDEITRLLASYPETNLAKKYQHFFCLEVAVGMYHQGEDRNRNYFWSATPFYSVEFFTYAMKFSDNSKKGYRLYREFLTELHPHLHAIRYANWNAPVASTQFKLFYATKNLTRAWPAAIRRLRRITGRYDTVECDSIMLGCLREQSERNPDLGEVLNLRALKKLLENARAYDKIQLWTLFTLASFLDDWTNPRPVLADYLDREFA